MPAPKGHAPYPGCEKGGEFGYLSRTDDDYNQDDAKRLGEGLIEYIRRQDKVWFKGYFAYEGISGSTIENLKARFPYFANCVKQAKMIQESKLVDMPFFKTADTNIAKFVLANNHEGWVEKSETKISGDATNPLSFIVNDITGSSRDFVEANEEE